MTTVPDIAQVRARPGMYIGGTGPRGIRNMVFEVMSNSFDLVLAERAARITVTVWRDTSITIDDDGPGMQVDDRVGPSVEEIFTTVRDTPTADGHKPHVHIVPGGVGLGPICALCSEVDLEIRRDGATYRQSFSRAVATSDLVRTEGADGTGTTVRMVPDPAVFADPEVDVEGLADDMRELALLTPGLTMTLVIEGREPEVFGPVTDLRPLFVDAFTDRRHPEDDLPEPMLLSGEGDDFAVDLALGWVDGFMPLIRSYGNFRRTDNRGHHVDGIVEGLREVFGHGPTDRLMGGLRAVVHVKVVDPVLVGPSKDKLISPEAIWRVADVIAEQLPAALAADPELEEDLRSRVPTREAVALAAYEDEVLRLRRNTPI